MAWLAPVGLIVGRSHGRLRDRMIGTCDHDCYLSPPSSGVSGADRLPQIRFRVRHGGVLLRCLPCVQSLIGYVFCVQCVRSAPISGKPDVVHPIWRFFGWMRSEHRQVVWAAGEGLLSGEAYGHGDRDVRPCH